MMTRRQAIWITGIVATTFLSSGVCWVQAKPSARRLTPLVRAIAQVRPAVVNIRSKKEMPGNPLLAGSRISTSRPDSMGTGVILDPRGYIVTNYHVIQDVATIKVSLHDGTTFDAHVISRDPETDLAMIKITPTSPLPVMPLGHSHDLMHGEDVIAIGNAFGYEHTISRGIISQLHRDLRLSSTQVYRDLIQTDAAINPGNSGGPLINGDGDMIGLNVAIRAKAQGIGFAIPVDEVKRVVIKLMSAADLAEIEHGLTVETAPATDEDPGRVIVKRVAPGGPGQLADLRPGDRLLAIDGQPLRYAFDLERLLLDTEPNQAVKVKRIRRGRTKEVVLILKPLVQGNDQLVWKKLGFRIQGEVEPENLGRLPGQLRGGLRIQEVANDSAAARAGFEPGDVLVGLHHWETLSLENVAYVLKRPSSERINPIKFYLIRAGRIHHGWLALGTDAP